MVMDIYDSGSTDRYSSKYRINKTTNRKRIIRQIIDETEPAFNCEPDLNMMLNQSDALFELLDYKYLQLSFRLCTRINRDLYLRDIWHKITIYNSNKKVKSKYRIYANSNREEIKNKIIAETKLESIEQLDTIFKKASAIAAIIDYRYIRQITFLLKINKEYYQITFCLYCKDRRKK